MKTVAIDLDGVLNLYKGKFDPAILPEPRPGTEHFLQRIREMGYQIVIHTCRDTRPVGCWLQQHNLWQYIEEVTRIKPPAHVYIDDRGLQFRGSYVMTLLELESFEPHWKGK